MSRSPLRTFVEEVEALKEQQDAIDEQIRAVYARAKDAGIDKTAMGQVITIRRRWGINPRAFERCHILTIQYLDQLDNDGGEPPRTRTGMRARELA